MSALHPTFDFRVMDVRALELKDSSIDVAIDKGTLDAMLHGSLWDPPEDVKENVGKYVDEVLRILRPGARWLYITYRQSHFMRPLLQRDGWKAQVEVLGGEGGTFEYFGWIMNKHTVVDSSLIH